MNILFFFTSEVIQNAGGVENVTIFWYNYFKSQGNNVYIMYINSHPILQATIPQTQIPDPQHYDAIKNIEYIKDYIITNQIDIVINQAALNNKSSLACTEACRLTRTRLISVIHNTPQWYIKSNKHLYLLSKRRLGNLILNKILSLIQRAPFYKGGRYIYENSEAIVVLSPSYIKEYCDLNVGKSSHKVTAIANPLIFSRPITLTPKSNTVLFVGRLSDQKAIDKLLHIWHSIEALGTNWNLKIIGDGPNRLELQQLSHSLNLRQVSFIGYANPIPYYLEAKILCLTSLFEGFPMTLIECQAYGVVPIVYDSFSAAHDIIENTYNGYVIPQFNEKLYVSSLYKLMQNPTILNKMQEHCRKIVDRYNVDTISQKWCNIIYNKHEANV